ncbi:MAG TPA: PDZ domain-containing protein [Limnochordales bacterium]
MRRGQRAGAGGVVLYNGGVVILALLAIVIGLVALALHREEAPAGQRVVIVQPDPRPPGLSRIPPGQLKKRGYVRVVTMTPSVAAVYKVRYQQGVLVTEIVAGDGPGVTLLLQPGDIIVAVEGEPVTTLVQLRARIERHRSDQWVKLTVVRAERMVTLLVPVEVFAWEA